ncbi:hypothetical protein [Pedobacter frigoris]|uniref:hypothetical protein n=1 Tax=Pedobacter frigoris TaxID=2571272 RepID=UPI002931A694|nr:hypothetical protein [Pedobacter frigoris]
MKKNILYLLAAITTVFTACNPLKDEINNISPIVDKTFALVTSDYNFLPTGNYAKAAGYFFTVADANASIPVILNIKYPNLGNGSKAIITYNSMANPIKPADSLLSASGAVPTQYTVTDADYAAINGNANKNFNATKVIEFLNAKFPVRVENQLVVLSYVYFQAVAAPVVETFLYIGGAWVKPYHVSQAQYISAGKITAFNFAAADEPNLNSYFNTFLKSDAAVSATTKVGDVKYVSYAYFASRNYQRIRTLTFDGVNWVAKPVPAAPLTFLKKNGTWIPDPTIYYTLVKADFEILRGSNVASEAAVANAVSFGSFDKTGGANNWKDEEIKVAVITMLNNKYKNAAVDASIPYKITHVLFRGPSPTVTNTYIKTATGFVLAPEN